MKRKCKHNRIPDHRFKIHVIIVNRVVKSFVKRIREKLLKLDSNGNLDVDEAPDALPRRDRVDPTTHEDAVVQRLEAGIQLKNAASSHADDGSRELIVDDDVLTALAHLARAVHEVEDGNVIGVAALVRHGRSFYADGAVRQEDAQPRVRILLLSRRAAQWLLLAKLLLAKPGYSAASAVNASS